MMSGGAAASPMGMGAASPYGGGSPYGQGNPQAAYMQQMQMMQMVLRYLPLSFLLT